MSEIMLFVSAVANHWLFTFGGYRDGSFRRLEKISAQGKLLNGFSGGSLQAFCWSLSIKDQIRPAQNLQR